MDTIAYDYTVEGAFAALEHAGRFVNNAALMSKQGSNDAATVLAALASEALGQFYLLVEIGERIRSGEQISMAALRQEIRSHERRQKKALTGAILFGEDNRRMMELSEQLHVAESGTPEEARLWHDFHREGLRQSKKSNRNRGELRERASYVNPIEGAGWDRPSEISKQEAEKVLYEAINGYSLAMSYVKHAPVGAMGHEAIARAFTDWQGMDMLPKLPTLIEG